MKYSAIAPIEKKLCEIELSLGRAGVLLEKIKDIPYGVQISAKGQTEEGMLTIYYSDKKGLSVMEVRGGNSATKAVAEALTGKKSEAQKETFFAHFGSDEAGKGDFFGPLITAAFCLENQEMRDELVYMGVCDSKRLTDNKIAAIAKVLYAKYPKHIAIIRPSVEKHNDMYTKFQNLNLILGWHHATAMEQLKAKFNWINVAVFDKFAEKHVVTKALKTYKQLEVRAIPHAEDSDLAVAAASILARDYFVRKVQEMSEIYGVKFPLGATDVVIKAGKEFVKKHGREKLKYVAKTHFKTVERLG